jgi:hypothetical protein
MLHRQIDSTTIYLFNLLKSKIIKKCRIYFLKSQRKLPVRDGICICEQAGAVIGGDSILSPVSAGNGVGGFASKVGFAANLLVVLRSHVINLALYYEF